MSIKSKFAGSFSQLKNIYALASIAMLLALRVVLGFFANGSLAFFGNTIKISGAFLPTAVTAAVFGPIPAALVGALGDIISFFLNPSGGMYFPGFTISGFLSGMIFGLFFYKNSATLKKVIGAYIINGIFVEILLGSYWLFCLYSSANGKTYWAYLTVRLISCGVKLVPEVLLIFSLCRLASKIKIPKRLGNR